MNAEEFKAQARLSLEQALNQLQTVTLLVAELEKQVSEVGQTLKTFAQIVEQLTDQPEPLSEQAGIGDSLSAAEASKNIDSTLDE